MGVVVRRYMHVDILTIINTFPYSTCISSFFWQQHPYFFVHFLKCFFGLVYVIFLQYISKCYSKNIRDRSKNRDHANIIIKLYPKLRKSYVRRMRACVSPVTSTCEVPNDV